MRNILAVGVLDLGGSTGEREERAGRVECRERSLTLVLTLLPWRLLLFLHRLLADSGSQLEQLYDPLNPYGSDPVFMRSAALYNPRMAGKEGDFYNLTAGSLDVNIQGRPNGFYPRDLDGRPGGFPVVIPNTADKYHSSRLLGVLQEGAFFDDHTQSLMVELPSYNHKTHLLGYAATLFTWSTDGRITMKAFTPVAIPDFAKGISSVAIPVLFSILAIVFVCVSKAPETVTTAAAYASQLLRIRQPQSPRSMRKARVEAFGAESLADVALLLLMVGCIATYSLQATLVNGIAPKTDYNVYDAPLVAAARFFMPAKVDSPSEEVTPDPEDETSRWALKDDETGMDELGGLLHSLRAASRLSDLNTTLHGIVILLAMLRLIQTWSFKAEVGIFYKTLFLSASGVADIMIVTMCILCGFAALGTLTLGPHFKHMTTFWGSLGFMLKTFVTGDLGDMHDAVLARGLDRNPASAAATSMLYYSVNISMGFVMTQFVLAVIVSNFYFVKLDDRKKSADFASVLRLRFEKQGKKSKSVIEAISGGSDDSSDDDDDEGKLSQSLKSMLKLQAGSWVPKIEIPTPLQTVDACLKTATLHLFEMQAAIESLQAMNDTLVDLDSALSHDAEEAKPWAKVLPLPLPGQPELLHAASQVSSIHSQRGTNAHLARPRAPISPRKPGGSLRGSSHGAESGGSQRGISQLLGIRRGTGSSLFTPRGSQRGNSQPLAMLRGSASSLFTPRGSQGGDVQLFSTSIPRDTGSLLSTPRRSQGGDDQLLSTPRGTVSPLLTPRGSQGGDDQILSTPRGTASPLLTPRGSQGDDAQPLVMRRGTGSSSIASPRVPRASLLGQGSHSGSQRVSDESMSDGITRLPNRTIDSVMSFSPRKNTHESSVSSLPSLDEGGTLPHQPITAPEPQGLKQEVPMSISTEQSGRELGPSDNLDTASSFADEGNAVTSFRQLDDLQEAVPAADETPVQAAARQSNLGGDDIQIQPPSTQSQTSRPSHGRVAGHRRRSTADFEGPKGKQSLGAAVDTDVRVEAGQPSLKGKLEELPPSTSYSSGQNWKGPDEASTSAAAQDPEFNSSVLSMKLMPEDSADAYHSPSDKHEAGKGGLIPEGVPGTLGGPPDVPAAKAKTPNTGQKPPRGIFGRSLFSREKPSTAPSQKPMGMEGLMGDHGDASTKDAVPRQPGALGNADEERAVVPDQLLADWWSMKQGPSSASEEQNAGDGRLPSPSTAYDSTPVARFHPD